MRALEIKFKSTKSTIREHHVLEVKDAGLSVEYNYVKDMPIDRNKIDVKNISESEATKKDRALRVISFVELIATVSPLSIYREASEGQESDKDITTYLRRSLKMII